MQDRFGRVETLNVADKSVEILIDGIIGSSWLEEGITVKSIRREVAAAGDVKKIKLLINSPGGLVDEGLAIYTYLHQHPAVVDATVLGLAASAATFPLMAADRRIASELSEVLIHNSRVFLMAVVTKELMNEINGEIQEILGQTDELLSLMYQRRTGMSKTQIDDMMVNETYMTASKAFDLGFIDEVLKAKEKEEKPGKVEDHQEKLAEIWGMWLDDMKNQKARDKFDKRYRAAASTVAPAARYASRAVSFTTEPWRIGSVSGSAIVNVNELRWRAIDGDEKAETALNQFRDKSHENKQHLMLSKIELLGDDEHVYPLSTKEARMLKQILAALGVENVQDGLDKIKEMKAQFGTGTTQQHTLDALSNVLHARDDRAPTGNTLTSSEAQALRTTIDALNSTIQNMRAERQAEKNAKRDEIIEAMTREGYFQDEKEIESLRMIRDTSEASFDLIVAEHKRKGPQYTSLLGDAPGTGAVAEKRKRDPEDPGDQLVASAEKIMAENKGLGFTEALARAEYENPKLIEALHEKTKQERGDARGGNDGDEMPALEKRRNNLIFGAGNA